MRERAEARAESILDVVVDLLESEGYEAVQVRSVARRAQVSLATVYKTGRSRPRAVGATERANAAKKGRATTGRRQRSA